MTLTKKGKKMGRPEAEIDWDQFESLCSFQCTLPEIAAVLKCSPDTVENRVKKQYGVTFSAAWKTFSAAGRASVRRAQFLVATKRGNPTMLMWLGKQMLDQTDKTEVEHSSPGGGPVRVVDETALQLAAAKIEFANRALARARAKGLLGPALAPPSPSATIIDMPSPSAPKQS